MEPSDEINGNKGTLNDVLYRRLKNRERQRRYRERKRLQADASNDHVINQSSKMQIVPLLTDGIAEQVVTRVHCRRDWKKDARRAQAAIPEAIFNGLPPSGNNMPYVPLGMQGAEQNLKIEVPSEFYPNPNDNEKSRSKSGRRDWKAEARNKK